MQTTDGFGYHKHDLKWQGPITSNNDFYVEYLKEFLTKFVTESASSIQTIAENYTLVEDEVFSEAITHTRFSFLKTQQFVEVETTREPLSKVAAFLDTLSSNSDDSEKFPPLVLCGDSGSGKTSILAVAAVKAAEKFTNAVVVLRFLGTTAGSSSATSLLTSLYLHLDRAYELYSEPPPTNYLELIDSFNNILSSIPQDKPLILFLDSLDQLAQDGNDFGLITKLNANCLCEGGQNLAWLSTTTNASVRIVVSTLPNKDIGCLQILQGRYSPEVFFFSILILTDES
jgi:hypothetical protein